MIYFLGGASRAGKSKYAKRIAEEKSIQYIALDQIRNSIQGRPDNSDEVSNWFYPHLKSFIEQKLNLDSDYILEIDLFYPEQVIELAKNFPVRACFIGSSTMDKETLQKMNCATDWQRGMNDAQLENLAIEVKNVSEKFKQKSEENNFKYIDVLCLESSNIEDIKRALFTK